MLKINAKAGSELLSYPQKTRSIFPKTRNGQTKNAMEKASKNDKIVK